MANIDYKAAYQELVNIIRSDMELWRRESKVFQDKAFQAYCEDALDVMRACEGLEERYNGMADMCEHVLEESDYILERMAYEQEQQVKLPAMPTDDNGRVSLHLVNYATGKCVYDLDCDPSEVPARVWLELLCCEDGDTLQVSSQADHIHNKRMHEAFGFELENAFQVVYPYIWEDDCFEKADYGPDIWMAVYRDTALATC